MAGILPYFSTTAACADPLSLQNAEAAVLRQKPGLGAMTQKIVELKHQAVLGKSTVRARQDGLQDNGAHGSLFAGGTDAQTYLAPAGKLRNKMDCACLADLELGRQGGCI